MRAERLRLAFAGSPAMSAEVLDTLLGTSRYRIELVLTQPDRPAGRGRKVRPNAVKQCAERHRLPLVQAASAEAMETSQMSELDLLVVVAYGLLLPARILSAPRWGGVNVHFSLLPRWRGAAPVQHAILAGDQETGVSIMQMDAGLDTGAIYQQTPCAILEHESSAELSRKLTALGAATLIECLDRFAAGAAPAARRQNDALACYASKIDKRQAWVDWQQDADKIGRQVRAFNPSPVARARWGRDTVRIWEAVPEPAPEPCRSPPGTLVRADRNGIVVMAGRGCLRIRRLQAAGRRVMTAGEFLNGIPRTAVLGRFEPHLSVGSRALAEAPSTQ